ncbi:hypothetical protein GOODEAATRI_014609, partial [Goodea atripinnis]
VLGGVHGSEQKNPLFSKICNLVSLIHSQAERGHCSGLCMATGQQPKHCNDSKSGEEAEGDGNEINCKQKMNSGISSEQQIGDL